MTVLHSSTLVCDTGNSIAILCRIRGETAWTSKIGLISATKLGTLENVADLLTKHVPRAVLDKLTGTMGYTFPDEDTQRFQEYQEDLLGSEVGSN